MNHLQLLHWRIIELIFGLKGEITILNQEVTYFFHRQSQVGHPNLPRQSSRNIHKFNQSQKSLTALCSKCNLNINRNSNDTRMEGGKLHEFVHPSEDVKFLKTACSLCFHCDLSVDTILQCCAASSVQSHRCTNQQHSIHLNAQLYRFQKTHKVSLMPCNL